MVNLEHYNHYILIGLKGEKVDVMTDGVFEELVKMVACACDVEELREVLYEAVRVDLLHDNLVGRKYNIKMESVL